MNNWTHADFVCAAYAVTALVMGVLALVTWRDWRCALTDTARQTGTGKDA